MGLCLFIFFIKWMCSWLFGGSVVFLVKLRGKVKLWNKLGVNKVIFLCLMIVLGFLLGCSSFIRKLLCSDWLLFWLIWKCSFEGLFFFLGINWRLLMVVLVLVFLWCMMIGIVILNSILMDMFIFLFFFWLVFGLWAVAFCCVFICWKLRWEWYFFCVRLGWLWNCIFRVWDLLGCKVKWWGNSCR